MTAWANGPGLVYSHGTSAESAKSQESESKDMPQSLSSILIHLIFSTKHREPFITPEIESELHPYIASVFRALKSPALAIDGTRDHVHTLFALSRVITIADLVEEVKTESSKWIKTKGSEFKAFHWQSGYGAFFHKPIACGGCEALHSISERAPSSNHISGRVSQVPEVLSG